MQRTTSAPPLCRGETIGIAAPATCIEQTLLQSGAERLATWGYPVLLDPRLIERHGNFAGKDEIRADIFLNLLRNPEVKAIWCARGGYGVTRLLSRLDKMGAPALLRKKPKALIGYSDITALHLYAYHHAKLKSIHAPVVATKKWLELPNKSQKILQRILAGEMELGKKSHSLAWPTKLLHPISQPIEGRILGGNLTLLSTMIGTPWMPSLRGSFLFFEDCAEPAYKIDRMLTHLHNAGALHGIVGAFVGDLSADVPTAKGEKKKAWKAVLEDRLASFGIAVLYNLPVGHGAKNEALPLGSHVRLTRAGKIELLEQVLAG